MKLMEVIEKIQAPDKNARIACKKRWDSIAKPLNSLGRLEDAIIKIAGIVGSPKVELDKKALVILCADNGVVQEGVTQAGSEVTAIVANNFLKLQSCACVMAKQAGVQVFPIDIGMNTDTNVPVNKKVAYGTKNFAKEPAMLYTEAVSAIEVGIETVWELKQEGYQIIATGEMGIGNTTTSSAIAAVLLDLKAQVVTGKGAGLSKEGLDRKIQVIQQAIALHNPDKDNPLDVLSKLGGFDIAGMVGLFLGGAVYKVPIVIDGFISCVAALLAVKLAPECVGYMLASHVSREEAGERLLNELKLKPLLTCDMCLGEGSGAIAAMPLFDMALSVYQTMSTFEEIDIDAYRPL